MDIWQWYNQYERDLHAAGQPYITDHLNKLINAICDVKPDVSEALLPEARSFKKTAGNPWLEVFIGHWEMRHRLGMGEGETALGDAVTFFERAHQPDAIACPQSVCVTQDLSDCYGNIDGPGWADERIAVCQETMERITPLWSCFQCLSDEQFCAMVDKGETQQALDYIRGQIKKVRDAGEPDVTGLLENEAEALIYLGRYEDALAVIEPLCAPEELEGCAEQIRLTRTMIRAEAYACMGRLDDACNSLIHWKQLQTRGVVRWVRIIDQLCRHDASYNNWQTGVSLQQILEQRIARQAWRAAIDTAIVHIRLALARNATWIARRALGQAKACLPRLRKQMGADRALAELERDIAGKEQDVLLPVPADELYEWLEERSKQNEGRDPEQEAEWLKLAAMQLPDNEQLVALASSALEACHAADEAIVLLQTWRLRHPQSESPLLFELLGVLLRTRRFDEILALAKDYRDTLPHVAYWFEMQVAFGNEDWAALETLSESMLNTPEGSSKIAPLLMASRAAMKLRASERAIPRLQRAIAMLEAQEQETNNVLWDLITAASIQEEWGLVREAGTKLGMKFESEDGPIEENWGAVRLRFREEHDYVYYLAQRTGPATARVFQPAWPKAQQHLGDSVVFDVELLNTPPEDEAEREYFIGLYDVVEIIEEGSYAPSWFVDGVYPGEEMFDQFEKKVREFGGQVWVSSEADYEITDREHPEHPLPGVYFNLATPLSMLPQEVDSMLLTLTRDWPHPVHWLSVAAKGGLDEQRHRQIIDRYGL
ncbi:hypothetical protein TUM17576_14870 [Enterobacter hormaechei]|uniref:Tetratricopeptide repeat protein n=1 Tax=Phytobacter ursingii TaxID=1972431 RepID=A0AB35RU54_9ENTR|nr:MULTISPECIES: hypothetical protein [Enterobacteriaceae]MDV2864899.1 hypothetical protein [Phytobacter ursingii]GJL34667.1 hypothetical protein TUM17576_14870 [Enterobacter hormaechei]